MLRQTKLGFEFKNEVALEEFVWNNLKKLLKLRPLKRQFYVDGEVCDILAVSSSKQLTIIELKNIEDRYVVQQLTRYYHAITQNKPLSEEIDYSKPIQLIAIAPTFHKHSNIDTLYNLLKIDFYTYSLRKEKQLFCFSLIKSKSRKQPTSVIFEGKIDSPSITIPSPSRAFLNMLSACSNAERERVLELRDSILSFHPRIKETLTTGKADYGNGKNNTCITIARKGGHGYKLAGQSLRLFIRLPMLPDGGRRIRKYWMLLMTDDWIDAISVVTNAKPITAYQPLIYKWLHDNPNRLQSQHGGYYTLEFLRRVVRGRVSVKEINNMSQVQYFVNLALEEWQKTL